MKKKKHKNWKKELAVLLSQFTERVLDNWLEASIPPYNEIEQLIEELLNQQKEEIKKAIRDEKRFLEKALSEKYPKDAYFKKGKLSAFQEVLKIIDEL